jgi:chromate transporter
MSLIVDLTLLYGKLSLLAFGGGPTVMPEMQREVVNVHAWMNDTDFVDLFALAQAAPGPNMLIATLVGLRVAGLPGAIAATLGTIVPSSLLTLATLSAWERFRNARWRRHIQAGLMPVTAGLLLAAALLIGRTAGGTTPLVLIVAAVAGLNLGTSFHPLWLLGAGALLGGLL